MKEQELALKIKASWKYVDSIPGLLTGTSYSIWRSPDNKWEIGIHDVDLHIIGLKDVRTGLIVLNPRDMRRFFRFLKKELTRI